MRGLLVELENLGYYKMLKNVFEIVVIKIYI